MKRQSLRRIVGRVLIVLSLSGVMSPALPGDLGIKELDSLSLLMPRLKTRSVPNSPRSFEPLSQARLNELVKAGNTPEALAIAMAHGRMLFSRQFEAADGVGICVTRGVRFTRVPRADLTGRYEWASQKPPRSSGPDAQSCSACHYQMLDGPQDHGGGGVVTNVLRDPRRSARLSRFIQRQPPHLLGAGAKQVLAQEMTDELQQIRKQARQKALQFNFSGYLPLVAKGISFGAIGVRRCPDDPRRAIYDFSLVTGVDTDLVIKPFRWKGDVRTLRAVIRDAAYMQLGMQPTEVVGRDMDRDFDGVANELHTGDITALTIYTALQPRPTTLLELNRMRLLTTRLSRAQIDSILAGGRVFRRYGCSQCHSVCLTSTHPIFSEPSQLLYYQERRLPAGVRPGEELLSSTFALTADLTLDQTANQILLPSEQYLGNLQSDTTGHGHVFLFSDLKRHNMGSLLADPVDETGSGASVFLTAPLWGVGSTAPYLHDGRASTLSEAIRLHEGEAAEAKAAFVDGSASDAAHLLAFLNNLVLFKRDPPTIP